MGGSRPERTQPGNGRPPLLLQARSASPIEEAFRGDEDKLLGTLYITLGNLQEAQEAFQEAFLYCWRHRDQLTELGNRKLWIFRVVLDTARQRRATAWRRRWRLWDWQEDPEQATEPSQSSDAEVPPAEPIALCRQALMELAPEEQEVFLLRQNGQFSYEQIAALLRSPLGVVKAQMRRALTKLLERARSHGWASPLIGHQVPASGGPSNAGGPAAPAPQAEACRRETCSAGSPLLEKEDTPHVINITPML